MSYLIDICLEEIALEGLDGITPACLWCRLEQRLPKFPLSLDSKAKQFLWSGITARDEVTFYRLPAPRDLPLFPHEYMTTDEVTGIITLNEKKNRNVYPGCIINSADNDGIQGSCSTFKERVDISEAVRGQGSGNEVPLEEVQERWGDSLVAVASQELRWCALLGRRGDPSIELGGVKYCMLEFVGRMRHHGAYQLDFARIFNLSSQSLHNYRKRLIYYKLIDRRMSWCETTKQAQNFIMLTLRRFTSYAKHGSMTRFMILSTHITSFLDEQPKKTAKYNVVFDELAKKFPNVGSRQDLKTCLRRTYLMMQTMKVLQVIHFSSGNHDVNAFKLLKKSYDETEDAEDDSNNCYDPMASNAVAELPIGNQMYNLIAKLQHTPQGIDYNDMDLHFQMGGKFIRLVVEKSLIKNKLVKFNVMDKGRQRVKKFQTTDKSKDSILEKEGNVETPPTASASTESKETLYKNASITYMKRRDRILEYIRKYRVQENCFGMLKELRQAEQLEGSKVLCDRKSVDRIVDRLEKEGLCETFSSVVVSDDGKTHRNVKLVLDANIPRDDPKVMHIIQQVKFRMINVQNNPPKKNWPGTRKTNRAKLKTALGKTKRAQPKKPKASFSRKRVTQYQTLPHLVTKETKAQQACRNTHDALCGKEKEDKADEKDKKTENQSERKFILARGFYGCLQKMERIRVLHRFMWYLVYGMPKAQALETPQPVSATENEMPIQIKQEFDDSSSQFDNQTEKLSEAVDDVLNDIEVLIGGQDEAEGSFSQSERQLQVAGQSGLSSQADGITANQSRVAGGQDNADRSSVEKLQEHQMIDKSPLESEAVDPAGSQTAINLLESIQAGILSDQQLPSSSSDPKSNSAFNSDTIKLEPASSYLDVHMCPETKHKVYLDVMDWRRFIQPLPEYKGIKEGWCFLGDLIMSMPLVIFSEVIPIRYMIDGLDEFRKHPMKRLLLVKDLPLHLRRNLLERRRYMFSLEEGIERMCALGLGVYIPHHNEGKESLSTFICRNVSIVDTTTSKPGAFFITDKSYPRHKHRLDTLNDVEKFWFEMKVICFDTPLGTSRCSIAEAQSKPNKTSRTTNYARTVKSLQEPVIDDGRIPGDGRGACGYNSSFFCHLKRNWTSDKINPHQMSGQRFLNRFQFRPTRTTKTPGRLSSILQHKTVSLTAKTGSKEDVPVETRLVDVEKHKAERAGGKGLKRKRPKPPKKDSDAKLAKIRKQEEKRKNMEVRKLHMKEKRAAGIITRIVFNWTPPEDSVLLLCKVASTIINNVLSYCNLITWETVQQVFVKKLPNVRNLDKKDAKAIAKRSSRLMRNSEFRMNYSVCLGEVSEDKAIVDSIHPHLDKDSAESIADEYKSLVDRLEAKFRIEDIFGTKLPDNLATLHSDYIVEPMAKLDMTNKMFFKDENITDLRRLALHTIVLSTLSSQNASDYDARLAFKLYEQYDSTLLHDVFLFCRSKGLVSRSGTAKNSRRIVPHVPVRYQLSYAYIAHFKMKKMPHELPDEVMTCYQTLLESDPGEGVVYPQVTCGSCSCQLALILSGQVTCRLIVPKQVIILDSSLIDKEFLEKRGLLKKDEDSSDSDSDLEEGSEDEGDKDEELGLPQETDDRTKLDISGAIDGVQDLKDEAPRVVRVSFEASGDEIGKARLSSGAVGQESVGVEAAEADADSKNLGDSAKEAMMEENRAMETLSELADGTCSTNPQPSTSAGFKRPSFNIPSVTNLDHSYIKDVSNPPMPSGSGDWGRGELEGTSTAKGNMSESGDAPRNDSQVAASDGLPSDLKLTPAESADDAGTVLPGQLESEPFTKSQLQNATMKCLKSSQSSFTKWLILQGDYAPGVCGGTHIANLQENIAFNAFKLNLSLNPPSSTRDDLPPENDPFSSLCEFLLKPCETFEPMEVLRKPTELTEEAAYLARLFKGSYIQRKAESDKNLMERCAKVGLDSPSSTLIVHVYKQIEEAKLLGLTLTQLKRIMRRVRPDSATNLHLLQCIRVLLKEHMIWEVGSIELRLVATKHVSLWAIQSQRLVNPAQAADTDSTAKRQCLGTESKIDAQESTGSEHVDLIKEPLPSGTSRGSASENLLQSETSVRQTPVCDTIHDGKGQPEVIDLSTDGDSTRPEDGKVLPEKKDSNSDEAGTVKEGPSTETGDGRAAKRKLLKIYEGIYEPIEFVPYPWRKVNGEINRPQLFLMMRGIALLIISQPGIKESQLLFHFKDLFRKVDCLKLLQMMSDLGLITRHSVRLPKPSLFSSVKSGHHQPVYYYQPSVNCLTNMGTLFVN